MARFSTEGSHFSSNEGVKHAPQGSRFFPQEKQGGWTRARIVTVTILVIIALVGLCGFDLYSSSRSVINDAKEVSTLVGDLKSALKKGDAEKLQTTTDSMVKSAHKIRRKVHTPAWFLASFVPVYGNDVRTIMTLSDIFADLADNALVPIVSSEAAMNYKDVFHDGAINLQAVQSLSGALDQAQPAFARSAEAVSELPEVHIAALAEVIPELEEGIISASGMVDLARGLLPHLSTMFGGDGQARNYLVVALNNAEVRTAGGYPGSWTLVTVQNGKISMGKTVTLQSKPDDFLEFREDEKSIFTGITGNMGGIAYLPDFPRTASLMAQGYEHYRQVHVNGVVAIDPVFLEKVLTLTGGVTSSDGTLVDGTNTAWQLMSNAYWRFGNDGKSQDKFFAEVASLSFGKLMQSLGSVSITELYGLFEKCAAAHRIQVWMEDPEVEQLFVDLGFSGKLADDPTTPVLGVYVNDNTWSKMGWYVSLDTRVSDPVENSDGSKTYDVVTTIMNTGWADEIQYSPRYVWGYNGDAKRTDTDMVVFPFIAAPAGGSVSDIHTEGYGWVNPCTLYDRPCLYGVANMDARESFVMTYKVTTSPEATEPLTVYRMPLAQESLLSVEYAWE